MALHLCQEVLEVGVIWVGVGEEADEDGGGERDDAGVAHIPEHRFNHEGGGFRELVSFLIDTGECLGEGRLGGVGGGGTSGVCHLEEGGVVFGDFA